MQRPCRGTNNEHRKKHAQRPQDAEAGVAGDGRERFRIREVPYVAAHVCRGEREPAQTAHQRSNGRRHGPPAPPAAQGFRFAVHVCIEREERHSRKHRRRRIVQEPRNDEPDLDHQRVTLKE